MRPIHLRVAGLNSFIEEVEIDFSSLIERGLFGIFGPTGSGKSSILDAVTLALYGKIARDTKEFINKDCQEAYVSFSFSMGEKEKRIYSVERRLKGKVEGGFQTSLCRLYIQGEDEEEEVFDRVGDVSSAVESIIGLNYEDFSRSVVLPQGQFSRFLHLKNRPKRDMLERILKLSEFGKKLLDRVREEKERRSSQLSSIEMSLNQYQEIEEEHLLEEKRRIKDLESKRDIMKKSFDETAALREEFQSVYRDQKMLDEYTKEMGILLGREKEIERKREEKEKIERAIGLKDRILSFDELGEELKETRADLSTIHDELQKNRARFIIVEEEHREALQVKDEEIPLLIAKKGDIQRAIGLVEEKRGLDKEIEEERRKEKNVASVLKGIAREIKENRAILEQLAAAIQDLEKREEQLQIVPALRERILRGHTLALNVKDKEKEERKKRSRLNSLEKKREEDTRKEREAKREELELQGEHHKLQKEREALEGSRPKNKEELKDTEDLLEAKKKRLAEYEEKREKRDTKKRDRTIKEREAEKQKNTLEQLEQKCSANEDSLLSLEEEMKEARIKNMAGLLAATITEESPCPVCGSREHPDLAQQAESSLKEREEEHEKLKGKIKKLDKKRNNAETAYRLLLKDIENLEGEMRELETMLSTEEYKGLLKEVEDLGLFIENEGAKRSCWEKEWEKNRKTLQQIEKKREENRDLLTALLTRLKGAEEQSREMKEELQGLAEDKAILLKELSSLQEELQIHDFEEEQRDLLKRDEELDSLKKTLKEKREEKQKREQFQREKEDLFGTREKERGQIGQLLAIKENQLAGKKKEIGDLVGEREPKEYLKEMEDKEREVLSSVEKLAKEREEKREEITRQEEKWKNLEDRREGLEGRRNRAETALLQAIESLSLTTIDYTRELLRREKEMEKLRLEIETFNRKKNDLEANIAHVERELNGRSITEKKWEDLCHKKEELEEALRLLDRELIEKGKDLEQLIKDLEQKRILLKKKKKLDHELSLIQEINDLVGANRFVEYVATQKLHYIAKEASKRLLEITRDRYALELDTQGEFVICDNYNGGVRRDCNTLSGGETFLASLSLALALSSRIQLKGRTHMEFFFLDEGFGTLDSDLLELVMSSLEELHHERLSVGIISHVEELKNRVPIKLMVSPGKPGICGSSVAMVLS